MSIVSDLHPKLCGCLWCVARGRTAVAALSDEFSLVSDLGRYQDDGSLKFAAAVLVASDAEPHEVADWLVGLASELRQAHAA